MENKLLAANPPLFLQLVQTDHPEDARLALTVQIPMLLTFELEFWTDPVERKNHGSLQHLVDAFSWLNAIRGE